LCEHTGPTNREQRANIIGEWLQTGPLFPRRLTSAYAAIFSKPSPPRPRNGDDFDII